jgi:IS4 transposase
MQALFTGKTENLQNICGAKQIVVVKGFMGEPVRLKAEKIDNSFVTLVGKDGKTRIKLKVKYIYQDDEGTYRKLKNAFDSNDTERLTREWQYAKPIVIS